MKAVNKKPIIFSTPMVKAILDWSKTQTRRVVPPKTKKKYVDYTNFYRLTHISIAGMMSVGEFYREVKPYQPGDILWVRETWQENTIHSEEDKREKPYLYKADPDGVLLRSWRPSIHMPREAARLFLEVKSVRVERLQNISSYDVIAEGMGIKWLQEWIDNNWYEPNDNEYWIHDHFHDYDQSESFCYKCGKKIAEKMRRTARKEGATDDEIENIYLDGGWGSERDNPPVCEMCGKYLDFTALDSCINYEMKHYHDDGFNKWDSYILNQFLDNEKKFLELFPDLYRVCYRTLWDTLNAKRGYGWETNPWVWIIEFRRIK